MTRFARFGLTTITVAPLLFLASSAVAQQMPEMDYRPLAASIPVNNPWALALIALLIMTVGFLALRRSGVRGDRFLTVALPVLSSALIVAALTGPQVTNAIMIVTTDLDNPGGGTVGIQLGENRFENTSGTTQVIVAIRNLPDCDFFFNELGVETEEATQPMGIGSPQCVVRGQANPPFSVDTLASGESCVIVTDYDFEVQGFTLDEIQQSNMLEGELCRLPILYIR